MSKQLKFGWSCGVIPFCEHRTKSRAKLHQLVPIKKAFKL